MTRPPAGKLLAGRRILVTEDDYFLADDLANTLTALGAEVLGPLPSVEEALAVIEQNPNRIDAAVLDLNLQGQMAFPVADALQTRKVPFVFATGYDASTIPPRYATIPRLEKPINPPKLAQALFGR